MKNREADDGHIREVGVRLTLSLLKSTKNIETKLDVKHEVQWEADR
jgi:hypothetical protein